MDVKHVARLLKSNEHAPQTQLFFYTSPRGQFLLLHLTAEPRLLASDGHTEGNQTGAQSGRESSLCAMTRGRSSTLHLQSQKRQC